MRKTVVLVRVLNTVKELQPAADNASLVTALDTAIGRVKPTCSASWHWDWLATNSNRNLLLNSPTTNYGHWKVHRGASLLDNPITLGGGGSSFAWRCSYCSKTCQAAKPAFHMVVKHFISAPHMKMAANGNAMPQMQGAMAFSQTCSQIPCTSLRAGCSRQDFIFSQTIVGCWLVGTAVMRQQTEIRFLW